jgi:hypothetical protein
MLPSALNPLIELPNWLVWRLEQKPDGKPTKVPYQAKNPRAKAKSTDPKTWATYDEAVAALKNGHDLKGIGFCLLGSGFAAFDIDDCRNPDTGELAPWASAFVARVGSYTEITTSQTGLRIIGTTEKKITGQTAKERDKEKTEKAIHRKQKAVDGITLESYRLAERYIVMTGDQLPGTSDQLVNIDAVMDQIVAELDKQREEEKKKRHAEKKNQADRDAPLPRTLEALLYVPGKGSYPSRSELHFAFLTAALRARVSEETIVDACLDPARGGGIFEHCRENGGRAFVERQIKQARDEVEEVIKELGEWDAGDVTEAPPPRGWLLGNIFARKFLSSLIADGGVGKTALRYAQLLSTVAHRELTGEHVFCRCRVLIISLEDDREEQERRLLAPMLHYGVKHSDIKGWLFLASPGGACGRLMTADKRGITKVGPLRDAIEKAIVAHNIDIVSIDPFIKSHGVDENSNTGIDEVVQILTDLAAKHNIAVDVPHHTSKAASDPGNANRGRGASAMKDAARLVYTLTPMNEDEAEQFGIPEEERKLYVRMDSGKVNIAPPMGRAKWFKLVGVRLNNGTPQYPNGDEVQTIERWRPPVAWENLDNDVLNRILTAIDAGLENGSRYSNDARAGGRAAWKVVLENTTGKTEAQAKEIIKTWVAKGVLERRGYSDPVDRKDRTGLYLNPEKRPGGGCF